MTVFVNTKKTLYQKHSLSKWRKQWYQGKGKLPTVRLQGKLGRKEDNSETS